MRNESREAVCRGRRLRAIWGLLLVQPLSGCFLGTEQPDLALALPATYRAADRNGAALPRLDWWRGFGSRELSALMDAAETANLDVAVAVARVIQADAQARLAGAGLLPALDLSASASRARASQATGRVLGTAGPSERDLFSLIGSARYELDFWGRNRALLHAAEQAAVASRFDRETVALSMRAAVANAYFQVLAAQDRLRYARENIDSASRVLAVVRQRLELGTASALDLAQQESVLNTQRAAVPTLEQVLAQNRANLAVLLGRAPEFLRVRGGSMFKLAIPRIAPGLPSELLIRRPDIRAAEAELAAANANVEAARAAFLPSIQLSGQGGAQASMLAWLLRPEAAMYQVAAGLTQPIFDGGRLQGQLDLQKGRQEELLQLYRRTVLQALADVDTALVAVRQLALRERLQNEVVDSTRRAFAIAEQRLNEGTVDLITVLNTQQSLFQAQDTLAQVRLARLQAAVAVIQALGGGWISEQAAPQAGRP